MIYVKVYNNNVEKALSKLKKQVQALDNDMIRLDMKLKILIQERHIIDKHHERADSPKGE